jgi:hypothetical protein
MNDWAFLSMAKISARPRSAAAVAATVSKLETAQALQRALPEVDSARLRGVIALIAAVLVNVGFLGAIERNALNARTPAGEVIVAEITVSEEVAAGAPARPAERLAHGSF